MAMKDSTASALDLAGKALLLIAAAGALIGMLVVVIWFDEFTGPAQHIKGIRVAVGLLLIAVGLVAAIGGLMVKTTTKEDLKAAGPIGELGELLDRAGGLGLALVIVGALMLGVSFNADGGDRVTVVEEAPAAAP